jgi:ribosome-associated heat shock protein Hsp15
LERQRIDKWLWHARLVRSRNAAAALADGGHVRVNGVRISAASRKVAVGDVLTIAFEPVRILKILGFSQRRGPAATARTLYEDLAPAVNLAAP